MSIILIDDVLFNDKLVERTIRYNNCVFFLILNGTSIFFGLFYLYIYFMIPKYNNYSNSLSLFFSLFHLISNCFYFLIFFELYLYEPIELSLSIKIITMFNPLIIMCIYYWTACLTHNLYTPYYNYNYNRDMEKRVRYYKYILFIMIIVFYLYTLLNINYNDSQIISKTFTFISNYNNSYIELFYVIGLCIILFIVYKLYFILNKKADFIVSEYQEPKEKSQKLKNIFKSVVSRNIAYICYFLLTFIPANIIMVLNYVFNQNIQCFIIDFYVMSFISFFGSFLFLVKLFDPLMRSLIVNLLSFNREFLNNYNSTEQITMNTPFLTQTSDIIRKNNKLKTAEFTRNINIKKQNIKKKSFSPKKRAENNSSGNLSVYFSKPSKPIKKMSYCSEPEQNNMIELENFKYKGVESFNYLDKKDNYNINLEINEELYSEKNDSSREASNITSKADVNKSLNQDDYLFEKDMNNNNYNYINNNNKNIFEEQKTNSPNFNFNQGKANFGKMVTNSFNNITFGQNNIVNQRNKTICLSKSNNQGMISPKPLVKFIQSKYSKNSFNNQKKLDNTKSSLNIRSISINNNIMTRKVLQPGQYHGKRSISKNNFDFMHEEISSFASMNYHLEVNENLLRMIAISISLNECRIYDNLDEYKKYYKLTIPWENKNLYTETTKNREYNDNNIPSWLGIKNDRRFTNIQFKIMAYCPLVFHHIRLIDKLSIDDLISSLDPLKNMKKLKEMRVLGGRGNNSLFCTWDKKLILKTIDSNEKKILFEKMIIDFHCFMRESRSILSRIYGLYKIELRDKGSIYVIVQRNMDDLPFETKLLTFDFKGSTVDRQIIGKNDCGMVREKIWEKYKNKVLKDKDLNIIGLKFIMNFNDWKNITSIIDSDSSFLQNLEVTDYSLVVFVHKYRKEDLDKNKGCTRVIASKNSKYIFNFSIVDYLGPYNFIKKSEKFTKSLFGYFGKSKDTNFSVLDPNNYGERFRKFIKKIILDE